MIDMMSFQTVRIYIRFAGSYGFGRVIVITRTRDFGPMFLEPTLGVETVIILRFLGQHSSSEEALWGE
jgi:hypothetical protein